jgi:trigger factor
MKSSVEKVSSLERKLNIQVPAKEVQEAFERAFKGIQQHVQVKGFRKGKAPINTIRTMYGDRVKQDVINDLVQKCYASAINEHSLEPISYPAIEFDDISTEKDFSFTAEFEVRPDIADPVVDGLTVKKEKLTVNDELVDKTLDDIRGSRAETAPLLENRPAQKGDIATIDFEGNLLTGPLENGSAKDFDLELGGNQFIPGFEENVVGMTIGQSKDIQISFPEDYHVKDLAGKPVTFKTTLKGLKKKSLPELNDEFAKGLGGNYENLEALKKAIREDFEKRESKRINDEFKNRLMKVVVERNPVEVPKSLLQEQKKALVDDFKQRLKQQGMDEAAFADYQDKWDMDFNQTATFMIQSSFLSDSIARKQNLYATEADFNQKLQEYANETGLEYSKIKEFYADKDRRSKLMYQITEEKVISFLASKVKVQEVDRKELGEEAQA